jgi:phospholipid/cholesterol/gamma-HCH transport system substrate-binding protein
MDKEYGKIFRKTGIFVLLAVTILLLFLGYTVYKQKYFVRKHTFYTVIRDAVGLSGSTPVIFKGYEIGRVRQFSLDEDNNIKVRFFVYNEFINIIVEDSAINRNYNPITTRTSLEFLKGPAGGVVIDEYAIIPSLDMEAGKRLLAERKIVHSGDPVSNLMNDINTFVANLNRDDNYDQGSFFRMLYHLGYTVENMNETLLNFNSLVADLQKDYSQDSGVLLRMMVNLADLAEDAKITNALLAESLLELNQALKNYSDPDGLLIRMVDPTEEKFIKPLERSIAVMNSNLEEVSRILEFIYHKTPEISIIMAESRKSLSEVQKVMEGVKHSPFIRGGIREEYIPAPGQRIRPMERE